MIGESYQKCTICCGNSVESTESKFNAWKNDLQGELTIEEWYKACRRAQTQTANTRMVLLQYTWLMRVYYTAEKLNKCNRNFPDFCIKCSKERGTLFHCIWKCPRIKGFWSDVSRIIQEILLIHFVADPRFFILGIYPKGHKIKCREQIFIDSCLFTCQKINSINMERFP